ncbi:MAG: tyrosine-type recombinase/integrase [Chloroflexota bacterium]
MPGEPRRKVGLPQYVTLADVHRIIAACDRDRDRLLIEALWVTGGRISEVVNARAGDITKDGLLLLNEKQRGGLSQKHVYCPVPFMVRLRAYAVGMPPEAPLFGRLTNASKPIGRVMGWYIVTRAAARAGVFKRKFGVETLRAPSPHTYRHGCAIHMLDQGVPVNIAQAQLGHSSLQSTSVYLKVSDAHRLQVMSKIPF